MGFPAHSIRGRRGRHSATQRTQEEAQAYVNEGGRATPSEASAPISLNAHLEVSTPSLADARKPAKRQKKNDGSARITATSSDYDPGTGPLPLEAEDGFDRTITLQPNGTLRYKTEDELNARKKQPTGDFEGELKIWTDGAAKGNGRIGAHAGIGIWFGPSDER